MILLNFNGKTPKLSDVLIRIVNGLETSFPKSSKMFIGWLSGLTELFE